MWKLDNDNLKIIIIVLIILIIIFYLIKECNNIEKFRNVDKSKDTKCLLDEVLSNNCKPEYCNLNGWPVNKVKMPKNYTLTNTSTNLGCCIIPTILKENIYDSKFNNKYLMKEPEASLMMRSVIRQ
jgi:hypothetical protein